jgi:hypothetical protein
MENTSTTKSDLTLYYSTMSSNLISIIEKHLQLMIVKQVEFSITFNSMFTTFDVTLFNLTTNERKKLRLTSFDAFEKDLLNVLHHY